MDRTARSLARLLLTYSIKLEGDWLNTNREKQWPEVNAEFITNIMTGGDYSQTEVREVLKMYYEIQKDVYAREESK